MKLLDWRCFLYVVFALAPGLSSRAQEAPNLALTKTTRAPSSALRRIPKGGSSRFYGIARYGQPLNQEVRVHFYEWPQHPTSASSKDEGREDSDKNYRVDIFVRDLKKRARVHLAQSIAIESAAFGSQRFLFNSVDFHATWLSPKAKKGALLRLTCTDYNGFYGSFGTDVVIVFAKGWSGKASVNAFEFHGDHFGSTSSDFSSLDEKGVVQVKRIGTTSGVDVTSTEIWNWDGEKFAPTETKLSGADAPH